MLSNKTIRIVASIVIFIVILGACRTAKEEKVELTGFVDRSIDSMIRRTGVQLEQSGTGIYLLEDVMQVIAPRGNITSITLLSQANQYTLFEVGIGMTNKEVEAILLERFGEESLKTLNVKNNTYTCAYLDGQHELYVTYSSDQSKVVEVSYYNLELLVDNRRGRNFNAGELIAMIGDVRVYYNEAMVYLKSVQQNYESEYGVDIWDNVILESGQTFGELIKDEVMKQIIEIKIIAEKAGELGITLAEDELASARSYAREHYEGLSEEDRARFFVSEGLLELIYVENLLAEKVFETKTINVDTRVPDEQAKQITVQHILIKSVKTDEEGNTIPLPSEEREQALEKARTILGQARETKDFYSLAQTKSETKDIVLTFGRGESPENYSPIFEQEAFALMTGQLSDLITTDYGWHIIYSVSDFDRDATIQAKERIIEERRTQMFMDLYKEWAAEFYVVVNNEAWRSITFR